jgi:CubicO group peptidase (beta-lactamase class C family)
VDNFELDLHEPLGTFLPDWRKDLGQKVTLHHLLTHTSGMTGPLNDPNGPRPGMDASTTLTDFVERYCQGDLAFEPGSRRVYSNTGMEFVGHLIEEVTGKSYAEVLRERILEPLGMKDTRIAQTRDILPGLATGYMETLSGTKRAVDGYERSFSSGGLVSTPRDLFRFDRGLAEGKLLSEELLALQRETPYAWSLEGIRKPDGSLTTVMAHHGGWPGFTGRVWRFPDEGHFIVVLDNRESKAIYASAMCSTIANILLGYETPAIEAPTADAYVALIASQGPDAAAARFRADVEQDSTLELEDLQMTFWVMGHRLAGWKKEELALTRFWTAAQPASRQAWTMRAETLAAAGDTEGAAHARERIPQ